MLERIYGCREEPAELRLLCSSYADAPARVRRKRQTSTIKAAGIPFKRVPGPFDCHLNERYDADAVAPPFPVLTSLRDPQRMSRMQSDAGRSGRLSKKRSKITTRVKKKDPIFVDGVRPRPMYVDYKDLELLTKLISRQGKLMGRRKSGCTAASQHAVAKAVKRARFMALLPYVAD